MQKTSSKVQRPLLISLSHSIKYSVAIFFIILAGAIGYWFGRYKTIEPKTSNGSAVLEHSQDPFQTANSGQKNCGFFNPLEHGYSSALNCFKQEFAMCRSAQLGYNSSGLQNGVEDRLTIVSKDDTCIIRHTVYSGDFDTLTVEGYCNKLMQLQNGIIISSCKSISLQPRQDIVLINK